MSKKPQTTRTLNPLPFNDLDPKRFEDLVRQLVYDFRQWRSLEPTGRLGADDGYDARGFEITVDASAAKAEPEEDEDENAEVILGDRLWQIQCKREKTVTPAKIERYAEEMVPIGADVPYGVIFAAPCDFSKRARDAFRESMRRKGVSEVYLWGRADLEDMLFQPKNDNVLFAFFGISLQIRKRSRTSQIKSILATKRKAVRQLGTVEGRHHVPILIRDSNDDSYPFSADIPGFKDQPRWKKYVFVGHSHEGIRILTRKYIATAKYDFQDGKQRMLEWDYFEGLNLARVHDDYWNRKEEPEDLEWRAHRYLNLKIESDNRAYLEMEIAIPYSRIVEIDNLGDNLSHGPHVFLDSFDDSLFERQYWRLVSENGYGPAHDLMQSDDKLRKQIFPATLPTTEELNELEVEKSSST